MLVNGDGWKQVAGAMFYREPDAVELRVDFLFLLKSVRPAPDSPPLTRANTRAIFPRKKRKCGRNQRTRRDNQALHQPDTTSQRR